MSMISLSIFLCIDESRLEIFFQLIVHILFRLLRDPLITIPTYISETNHRRSQCWNGMSSIHLFICSIYFWSQRNNFNERLFFFNYPLYNTAIHLLSTNYCWPIQIDIYLCNVNSPSFFFLSRSRSLYKWKWFHWLYHIFHKFFVFVLLTYF